MTESGAPRAASACTRIPLTAPSRSVVVTGRCCCWCRLTQLPAAPLGVAIGSQTFRHEGVFAFFRGWLPSYLRLGPHFIMVRAGAVGACGRRVVLH